MLVKGIRPVLRQMFKTAQVNCVVETFLSLLVLTGGYTVKTTGGINLIQLQTSTVSLHLS